MSKMNDVSKSNGMRFYSKCWVKLLINDMMQFIASIKTLLLIPIFYYPIELEYHYRKIETIILDFIKLRIGQCTVESKRSTKCRPDTYHCLNDEKIQHESTIANTNVESIDLQYKYTITNEDNNNNNNNDETTIINNNTNDNKKNEMSAKSLALSTIEQASLMEREENQNLHLESIILKKKQIEGSDVLSFKVVKKIGKGSFSTVYQVGINEKSYAMKIINSMTKDVETEVQILQSLKHEHIIKMICYEYDKKYNNAKIVSEYLDNYESLDKSLHKYGAFVSFYVKKIGTQMILAMKYAHDKYIAHRDIKPANILFDGHDIKIIDWGMAIQLYSKNELVNDTCGSPYYMAPESFIAAEAQAYSNAHKTHSSYHEHYKQNTNTTSNLRHTYKNSSSKKENYNNNNNNNKSMIHMEKWFNPLISDIWQIGATIYELSHGCVPFYAKTYSKLVKRVLRGKVTYSKNIDPTLKRLMSLMIVKDVNDRPNLETIVNDPLFSALYDPCDLVWTLDAIL